MITVLRLGHRPQRDKRVTTHVCLTARAFGADRVLIAEEDDALVSGIRGAVKRWGGDFEIESGVAWRPLLREFDGVKVHLSMYGMTLEDAAQAIGPAPENMIVVVGAEKVPREVYELVDYNVGVGNQPHSEVAATGVFLYRVLGPQILEREFPGAQMRITPTRHGKVVVPADALEDE